ncbi:unnamed protein product [Nezara viridula]|uniref:Uncharacterized protein n=1 Tax=Nezara viridula TaxID=85310 RepID=A0A9P0HJU6_NEZVI|nr:unnamed protein product [Nezara viridula]
MERSLSGVFTSTTEMEKSLHDRDRVGVQDCVLLDNYTNEDVFIENLYKRFSNDIIYTYIGNVLVSVNPYKPLPIYGKDVMMKYQKTHMIENPPHVYAIAENAYRDMVEENKDHCILISGESGSGKTETSKKVLEYVAAVSNLNTDAKNVKDKLLMLNPVLEAFGNAKTIRNDNSSRFGKYMDIEFNTMGAPVGGNILNYLLEKSRVVHQHGGERNFHIFYQLLAGGTDELLETLTLTRDINNYAYLKNKDSKIVGGMNDAHQMGEVCQAMHVMGITAREQGEIMAIVASILHLGNIKVKEKDGIAQIISQDHLRHAASLLGCGEEELKLALTQRTIHARDEALISPLNLEMATYARDALAKAIYDRLFTWLVSRFNESLQTKEKLSTKVMGILDIYGFEIFETNSFEQFCINYCNEKLQQLFIELTLKSEQEEYLREGIEWEPVEYFNNNIIINLIEEKHKGIISLLDEECLRPGDTSDQTFLNKLSDNLSGHHHFINHTKAESKMKKILGRNDFALVHYAGDVIYDVNGFLDKNNDPLFRDLRKVMCNTCNSITQAVFPESELQSKKRPETAITQFKFSLNGLMNILMTKEPSYIRCIKPNHIKKAGLFSRDVVRHQVKYLGLMENLRVRRAGFAYRRNYDEFLYRYKSLSPETWPFYNGHPRDGVEKILLHQSCTPEEYRLGKTKIFIRFAKTLFYLEDKFQERKQSLATLIQSRWRGMVQWRKYKALRAAAIVIEKWTRRFLAQKLAQKRRQAVKVIRGFIEGFITRHDVATELNLRFIQTAKKHYLLRLSQSLPKTVLDRSWPSPPEVCAEASEILRCMYYQWLAGRYCKSITPERKAQMELKVLAECLFKDKKKSYSLSVPELFVENRLTESGNTLKKQFFINEASGQNCKYATYVTKFDRHGYKKRDRVLLLTEGFLYLTTAGEKQMKTKHKFPIDRINKLEITSERDKFLLVRVSPELNKEKGDLILEVPHLIEFITIFVDVTKNLNIVHMNNIKDGKIMHCITNGKERRIDITLGTNGPDIVKGQSGQLVVVG